MSQLVILLSLLLYLLGWGLFAYWWRYGPTSAVHRLSRKEKRAQKAAGVYESDRLRNWTVACFPLSAVVAMVGVLWIRLQNIPFYVLGLVLVLLAVFSKSVVRAQMTALPGEINTNALLLSGQEPLNFAALLDYYFQDRWGRRTLVCLLRDGKVRKFPLWRCNPIYFYASLAQCTIEQALPERELKILPEPAFNQLQARLLELENSLGYDALVDLHKRGNPIRMMGAR